MKSPAALKALLRRQWEDPARRETRLLGTPGIWPLELAIGRPSAHRLQSDLDSVKRHVEAWRQVSVGEVVWEPVRYRATSSSVDVPSMWKIRKPSEWIVACNDPPMRQEFETLAAFVDQADPVFHRLLIRRRSIWRDKTVAEIVQAARLAAVLAPGSAAGQHLRLLSVAGIDTKFFERNATLVTALLDARFDGEVSLIGLEAFLGAPVESDHWLLVMDLDGALLPFRKLRVRASELRKAVLPGTRLLIVENETCQHQLPQVEGTIAVLGSGLNLDWTGNESLQSRRVAYWGDIDSWGLLALARAREKISHLEALLMTASVFGEFEKSAVPEPVKTSGEVPANLTPAEQSLFNQLLNLPRGRLEQEFLPAAMVKQFIVQWASSPPGKQTEPGKTIPQTDVATKQHGQF